MGNSDVGGCQVCLAGRQVAARARARVSHCFLLSTAVKENLHCFAIQLADHVEHL